MGHAAGFVDPLFSKGLYTFLTSVSLLANLLLEAKQTGDYSKTNFESKDELNRAVNKIKSLYSQIEWMPDVFKQIFKGKNHLPASIAIRTFIRTLITRYSLLITYEQSNKLVLT